MNRLEIKKGEVRDTMPVYLPHKCIALHSVPCKLFPWDASEPSSLSSDGSGSAMCKLMVLSL